VTLQGVESLTHGSDGSDEASTEVERRERRGVKRALIVMLALILLLLGGVAGFFGYLDHTVSSNVTHADLLPQARPPVTAPDGTTVAEAGTGTNFLVIGTDARPGDAGRSDVIVLVHVPADKKSVSMIHFPRDLYVDIPGHGKNKINAAYAFGREPLLVQTMENLLKIRIHHVAKTDFAGFKNMTDAVGGVRVYAEEASDGTGNGGPVVIKQGWNKLNGEQALAFVRERYELSEGDISRGRRQLAYTKALLLQAKSAATLANPVKFARITEAATKNLVVDQDFPAGEVRDYAISLRNIKGRDVHFSTAPFTGFGTSPSGASIDIVDQQGMADLGEALRTDTMDAYADQFTTP
jgi:LCP family protein required for cell wall assembly